MLVRANSVFTKLSKYALGLAFVAIAAGSAGAQTTGTGGGGAGGSGGGAAGAGAGGAGGQVTFQNPETMTVQEIQLETKRALAFMDGAASTIRGMIEQARAKRDPVKVLCLNDKLNQTDVAIRSARTHDNTMRAAGSNKAILAPEFTMLVLLRDRAQALGTEANQCIGEESAFIGDTQITASIDPTIPPEDPGLPGPPDLGPVEPPFGIVPVVVSPSR